MKVGGEGGGGEETHEERHHVETCARFENANLFLLNFFMF